MPDRVCSDKVGSVTLPKGLCSNNMGLARCQIGFAPAKWTWHSVDLERMLVKCRMEGLAERGRAEFWAKLINTFNDIDYL